MKKCGAKIDGAGTEEIKISGTSSLVAANHEIIPDRVEAATLIIAAAITHGDVVIKGINPLHIESAISKLKDAGVVFDIKEDTIRVTVPDGIKPVDIKTLPYPGFPTDIQPQISALLTLSSGTSVVTETVFENRFMHAHELRRLGANIRLEGQSAIITGVPKLEGAPVKSRDLRAGAALVIAGLAAEGDTLIEDIDQFIIRGYDGLDNKLISLGAKIKELGNIAEYGYGEDIS